MIKKPEIQFFIDDNFDSELENYLLTAEYIDQTGQIFRSHRYFGKFRDEKISFNIALAEILQELGKMLISKG